MLNPVPARASARRKRVRPVATATPALPRFIAWLRRLRRSAWLLIAACTLLRIGAAIVPDAPIVLPAFRPRLETGSRSERDVGRWLGLRRAVTPRLPSALPAGRSFS